MFSQGIARRRIIPQELKIKKRPPSPIDGYEKTNGMRRKKKRRINLLLNGERARSSRIVFVRPLVREVKTLARASDTELERKRERTFPSEYSFAICLISLAFSNTGLARRATTKNPLSSPFPPSNAYTYPISVNIFMQSDTANDSGHLGVLFYFIFFFFYTQITIHFRIFFSIPLNYSHILLCYALDSVWMKFSFNFSKEMSSVILYQPSKPKSIVNFF